MKLKLSELYLGFQNKTFKIFSKNLADRGTIYKKEIIIATLSLHKEKDFFFIKRRRPPARLRNKAKLAAAAEAAAAGHASEPGSGESGEESEGYVTKKNEYLRLVAELLVKAEPYAPLTR